MKARLPDGCLLSQRRLSESAPAIDVMEVRRATTATVFANDAKIHQNFKKKERKKEERKLLSINLTDSLVQGIHQDGGSVLALMKVTTTSDNDRG